MLYDIIMFSKLYFFAQCFLFFSLYLSKLLVYILLFSTENLSCRKLYYYRQKKGSLKCQSSPCPTPVGFSLACAQRGLGRGNCWHFRQRENKRFQEW